MDPPNEWANPSRLVHLPEGSRRVVDADEEISDLYMSLARLQPETGLGYLDTTKATLDLEMELVPPASGTRRTSASLLSPAAPHMKRRREKHPSRTAVARQTKTIGIEIHQDLGSLRNRKGDTGSVLWRSSWFLAKHLLSQHYFQSPGTHALLYPDALRDSSIIELGAGTGMLSILLASICGSYTATDLYDSLKLVKRNVDTNRATHDTSRLTLEELDWVEVSTNMKRHHKPPHAPDAYHMVLAVDSIYNEYLVKPFVDTLASLCVPGSTTVALVVVELRSADVASHCRPVSAGAVLT